MEIYNLIPFIYSKLTLLVLILTRVSTMLGVFVMFRSGYVNNRVLVALSFLIAYLVLLTQPTVALNLDLFSLKFLTMIVMQLLIGFLAGFILNLVIEIFVSMGQIISSQIGLGMASLFDPAMGSITTLTQFYHFFIFILFLLLNGHLLALEVIVQSFSAFPIDQTLNMHGLFKNILNYSDVIFSGGLLLSMPIIIAVMLSNITLAAISRFAPQFNLLSVGMSMSLILGIIFVWLTMGLVSDSATHYLQQGFIFFSSVFRLSS